MNCKNCGAKLYDNHKYCTNCGMQFRFEGNNNINHDNSKKPNIKIGLIINLVLVVILITIYYTNNKKNYYISPITPETNDEQNISDKTTIDASKYVDTFIESEEDYKNKIDSISSLEKEKCSKLSTLKYEEEIIKKYKLYSVNLCELSDEYLQEILNMYEYAAREYDGIFDYAYSGQLLYDANSRYAIKNGFSGAIALYGILDSKNSNLGTNYRLGMLLNTTYFLDEEYFRQIIVKSINSRHFPPNATIYSPVIHELGHKLHYDLVFKKYGISNFSITKNNNYSSSINVFNDLNNNITTNAIVKKSIENLNGSNFKGELKEYTKEISEYAATNSNEAIAEAVHDYYLNKDDANALSKEIVKVLKEERAKYQW